MLQEFKREISVLHSIELYALGALASTYPFSSLLYGGQASLGSRLRQLLGVLSLQAGTILDEAGNAGEEGEKRLGASVDRMDGVGEEGTIGDVASSVGGRSHL